MDKTAKGGSNSDSVKNLRKAIPKLEPLDNLRHKRGIKSTHSRPVRPTMKKFITKPISDIIERNLMTFLTY